METTRAIFGDEIEYGEKPYDVLKRADALAVCTEWHEFRRPDVDRMRSLLSTSLVFDGRNLYDPVKMRSAGFEYHSIGRPAPREDAS
jgi:UDPglucose 6-dehydrogenase